MKSKEAYYDFLAVRKPISQMAALHRDFYTVQFIIFMGDLLFKIPTGRLRMLTQKQHQPMPFGPPKLGAKSSLPFKEDYNLPQ
jgi:hypothetical protein